MTKEKDHFQQSEHSLENETKKNIEVPVNEDEPQLTKERAYTQSKSEDSETSSHKIESAGSPEKNETWEWIKALVIAIGIAVIIRTFLFAPIAVDGVSMMDTLHENDRLIINKAVYMLSEPNRGDVLVFHYAAEDNDWIKRVIGLPGDTIEVVNSELYINGEVYEEPYLASDTVTYDFDPVTIEEGEIFVMGDNRTRSKDSRHVGPIPQDAIIGRAEVTYWPIPSITWVNSKQ